MILKTPRSKLGARDATLCLQRAANGYVWDIHGKRYIDLTSGWNVTNAGWNNPAILRQWKSSLDNLTFRPSWCTDQHQDELAAAFSILAPDYIPILSCSGSEAIDNALKVARLATGRAGVAYFTDSYHGSTLGAALVCGYEVPHLEGLNIGIERVQLPIPKDERALHAIERALLSSDSIGAMVFETVLTNAGCHVVPDGCLRLIARLSEEMGFLLICDEIGTGINRTGTFFAFQHREIVPHIVTCGKALTNGLYPLSAALTSAQLSHHLDDASFASTFGGTAAACAAACATLTFHKTNELGALAAVVGDTLKRRLVANTAGLQSVNDIYGEGLELAIHLNWEYCASRDLNPQSLITSLRKQAVFAVLSPDDTCLMIMPPLTTPIEELLSAIDIVCDIISK